MEFLGRKNHLRKLLEAKLSICYARLRKRIPPLLLKLQTPALLSHNSLRVTLGGRSYKAWSKWFQISPSPPPPPRKDACMKKIVAWLFHAWKFYFHAWRWNLHAWNESFSQKFSWIRFPCIKWCTAQLPMKISGAKNHSRGNFFVSCMHMCDIWLQGDHRRNVLTLPVVRLLSSKERIHFWKPSKPCHVGIHSIALAEYSQMSSHVPWFQSFVRFLCIIMYW